MKSALHRVFFAPSPDGVRGETVIGEGYKYGEAADKRGFVFPKRIAIPDSDRKGMFWCFGTTRIGKTKILENMITQDIRKGYSVVLIDPKNEIALLEKIVQVTRDEDRLEDLMYISSIFPEYSISIDPLAHSYMPEELVAHIVSGVEVGKEPFFYNVSREVSTALVLALQMTEIRGRNGRFNLNDIKNLTSQPEIAALAKRVQDIDTPEARQLYADLTKIANSPTDYYSKVSSSLRVALMELTSGNIGRIVGVGHGNRFIERLERGGRVIMVAHLGSMMTRNAAYTLGKVIVSMIQSFAGRVISSDRKVNPPLCIYIDEAQSILYPKIDELFAKAGGANVWVHGFAQSVSQMFAAVGHDYAKTILDNTNTKVFMRVPDTETAEYAARHFGEMTKFYSVLGADGGVSMREETEYRIKPQDVLGLGERQFYLMTYGGQYKGVSSYVHPSELKIVFPEVRAARIEEDT